MNTPPVSCPFSGSFKFSYRRGHGECREPLSSIDSCIEDSRLLFRFQACADIAGSESRGEYYDKKTLLSSCTSLSLNISFLCVCLFFGVSSQGIPFEIMSWERQNFLLLHPPVRERETTSNISFCSKGLKPWNILSREEQRSCCWRSCDDDSGLSEHCSCLLGVKKLSEIFEKKKTGRRITFCKKRGKETLQRLQSRECNQGKSQWIPLYAFTGNKTSETEWEPEENLWEHPWMRMIWWQKEERRRRVQRSRELESLEIDCLCKEIRGKIDAHRELIQWFLGWEKSWDEH